MDIAAGYSALTAAFEIAKGLKNIDDQVKLNAAIIELQGKILSAQQAATDAKAQIQEMQQKIDRFETWEQTASRYQLKDFGGSTFAYELIPEKANGEPSHRICPKCFSERKRSILQFKYRDDLHRDHYKCSGCGSEFDFGLAHVTSSSHSSGDDYDPYY